MNALNKHVQKYLAEIGRRGGQKSRRMLSSVAAQEMVRVREARRAFKIFHTQCFWSYSRDLKITKADIAWVSEQLMKNGGRSAWQKGAELCR